MGTPNSNIDIFPLIKSCNTISGFTGEGPTGPRGKKGARGRQGPAGSAGENFEITSETLIYVQSPLVVSNTLNTTYITNTTTNDALFTLAAATENFIKYIYLNDGTLPVKISTSIGSFNLTANNPQIQLTYKNNRWVQLSDKTPWYTCSQQGDKLVSASDVPPRQGTSVALSADGNTLAIGGPKYNSISGATWIYTRSGTDWSLQGSPLVGNGGTIGAQSQGISVALSADGNTLAVGAPENNSNIGATWIFTYDGTNWNQHIDSPLIGTGGTAGDQAQGTSVALSADGNTLAVGGPLDNSNIGATWIFTYDGTNWTQHIDSPLIGIGVPPVPAGDQAQGISVALSADGNTLAVGARLTNSLEGATWIFTHDGTNWDQQGSTPLIGTGGTVPSFQGASVALSYSGNTLAVGGNTDNSNKGATWIFTRSGTIWTQYGSKLVGTGGTAGDQAQGFSVALAADGQTLAVGTPLNNSLKGGVFVFTKNPSSWTQKELLIGTGGAVGSQFQGSSVALSADGNTLASGGPIDNGDKGATWIFK